MTIHREGRIIVVAFLIVFVMLVLFANRILPEFWAALVLCTYTVLLFFVIQFFRHPKRPLTQLDDKLVYAPADGKVVVIEATEEPEYFKDKRLQVSIFMSLLNVHVNRNPVSGTVRYRQYQAGKYLVAWHPKSSTENERLTVVLNNGSADILVRQIAGAMARRIINYLQIGQKVKQGEEMGFIRFGSRVDVFLPLDAKVEVEIGQAVKANIDVIARLR